MKRVLTIALVLAVVFCAFAQGGSEGTSTVAASGEISIPSSSSYSEQLVPVVRELFVGMAFSLTGKSAGGPAKASVVSSALMGTMSGSAVANVVTTGAFTIPLMKKNGYEPHFAGAVEAVSSTGGQIFPPVMGAAAFMMAEMTGITYNKICIAAILPALLYFISVFFSVDLVVKRQGRLITDPPYHLTTFICVIH